MSRRLDRELGWRRGFNKQEHEGLLNIYFTGELIRKKAREFFSGHGITDVQFSLMELLRYQAGDGEGLSQADLSRMMLVNRSNITSILDRMEKAGLVRRVRSPRDRRANVIELTSRGGRILDGVEDAYMKEVGRIMGRLSQAELKQLVASLGKVRERL